jgi:methylthioribose-1-phosphate isomerase
MPAQPVPEQLRTLTWDSERNALVLLDQTALPSVETTVICGEIDPLIDAIQRLVVRGAPALGAAGAYGVVLVLQQGQAQGWSRARIEMEIERLRQARPTAVNLAWGVDRVASYVDIGLDAVLAQAHAVAAEDAAGNRHLSELGANWILEHVDRSPLRALTHCNAGALATTEYGTALGVLRSLHQRAPLEMVYADETRPLLQGSRLTAWELQRAGIPCRIQVDGAAASTIMRGLVDVVVIGADRIARNGDTANKIGSVGLALACQAAGIPFVVAAPWSTFDLATADGTGIPIELRDGAEITHWLGELRAPGGVEGFNPAFDVTPAHYISAIVTERGVIEPDGVTTIEELLP